MASLNHKGWVQRKWQISYLQQKFRSKSVNKNQSAPTFMSTFLRHGHIFSYNYKFGAYHPNQLLVKNAEMACKRGIKSSYHHLYRYSRCRKIKRPLYVTTLVQYQRNNYIHYDGIRAFFTLNGVHGQMPICKYNNDLKGKWWGPNSFIGRFHVISLPGRFKMQKTPTH